MRLPAPHRADGRDSSNDGAMEHGGNLGLLWTLETDACRNECLSVSKQILGMCGLLVVGR